MQNEFRFEGSVRSEPVLLTAQRNGQQFVKFTIRNDPDFKWFIIQRIKRNKETGEKHYGEVYLDCFCILYETKDSPGKYAIENVHKGDTIKAVGKLRSGRRPVKEKTDQFRANWVYGDYLYVNIKELEVTKKAPPKTENPYKKTYFSDYPSFPNQMKSADQYVSDDDLIFDI